MTFFNACNICYYCSVMVPPDIVGVWTVVVGSKLEQEHHLVQHPLIATIQVKKNQFFSTDRHEIFYGIM